MITKTFVLQALDVLPDLVNTAEINALAQNAAAVFIQVFYAAKQSGRNRVAAR